jgi:hypothetical protein
MPTYEIVGPDGGTYHIDADSEDAALSAFHPDAGFVPGMMRKFKQGAALGFGDEASGLLKGIFGGRGAVGNTFGERYTNARDYERRALDAADKSTGWYGTGAEVVGSIPASIAGGEVFTGLRGLMAGKKAVEAGVPLLTRAGASLPVATEGAGASLPAVAGSVAPRAAVAPAASRANYEALKNSMGAGAVTGAVQAAGDADTIAEMPDQMLKGSLVGTVGGAAGHALGASVRNAAALTNAAERVARSPSTQSLKDTAQAFYDRFENSGGRYTPAFVGDMRDALMKKLQSEGWSSSITSKPIGVMRELDKLKQMQAMGLGMPTPTQIQNVRSMIQNIRRADDDNEARFGSMLMDEFDKLLTNPADHHFVGGDGRVSAANLAEGNRHWRSYSKANELDDAMWRAQNRAGSTYSGGNINNAMRQNLRSVWEKNGTQAYTPDENAAMEVGVRGNTAENAARKIGNFSPLKGPVSALALGSILHDYPELALAITGVTHGAKVLGDRLTRRNVNEAMRVVRAGGTRNPVLPPPNAIQRGAARATQPFGGIAGAAAVRGLLDEP